MTNHQAKNKQKLDSKNGINPLLDMEAASINSNNNFWKKNWWSASLLLILAVGIYWPCTDFGYVLDDQIVITDNTFTKKGFSGISDILTTESMTGYFGEQKNLVEGNRYRPLSLVTFAMEYGFFNKLNPSFSHWINILLYGLTGILLFRLLTLLMSRVSAFKKQSNFLAFGIALLFLSHPIHVEAVANIKGRDEILAFLFSIVALFAAFKSQLSKSWAKNSWLIFGNVLLFLGLLSKENAITFLAIIPLTTYIFTNKSLINSIKSIWSFLITTILYLVLRFSVSGVPKLGLESQDLMNNPFLEMHVGEKLATIIYTLGLYVKLIIAPHPLTHDYYPYAIPKMNFTDWEVWLSLIAYLGLAVYAVIKLRSKSIASYAILFYLITLTIVSNLIINLGTFMNDRFIYFSSLGFCILLIYGLKNLYDFKPQVTRYLSVGIFALIFIVYSGLSINRVPDWESALTLNQSAIKVSSNSARANTFMATALFKEANQLGDAVKKKQLLQEALPYAEKSVEIHPSYYNGNMMVVGIAAEIHKSDQNIEQLIKYLEPAMVARPDVPFIMQYLEYLNGRSLHQKELSLMHKRVAKQLIARNRGNDARWAINYLNMAYNYNVNDYEANKLIGEAYTAFGDYEKAQPFLYNAATLK
jgi:tetratricopeptide (TPR) repeat protein